jgi:hypothetical protein
VIDTWTGEARNEKNGIDRYPEMYDMASPNLK